MDIKELLNLTIHNKASDLHLLVGIPPSLRIDGTLRPLTNYHILKSEDVELMVFSLLTPEQKELLLTNKELDFSFGYSGKEGGEVGRFRINAYFQRGYLAAALRFLAPNNLTIENLNLPKVCRQFTTMKQGFILVTGPSGHGKT